MLREEGAKRRGKFFVRPVSGPGQRVQVIKAKTGARGLRHASGTRNQNALQASRWCHSRPQDARFFGGHFAWAQVSVPHRIPENEESRQVACTGRPHLLLNRRRTFRQRFVASQASHRAWLLLPLRTDPRPASMLRQAVTQPPRQRGSVAPASSPAASLDWLRSPLL